MLRAFSVCVRPVRVFFACSIVFALPLRCSFQHHAERLRMSDSPLQHMQRVFSGVEGINEAELRRQLGEWVDPIPAVLPPD